MGGVLVGGRVFSLLLEEGGEGALPRRQRGGGGVRIGREEGCGRLVSRGDSVWGEGLSASSWRWLGGRGAMEREDGDLPDDPSPTALSLGAPPGNSPPIGGAAPDGLPAALPLAPAAPPLFGLSSIGALRSFTRDTVLSLEERRRSLSRGWRSGAPSALSRGGALLAWLKVGGEGGPPGGGGIGILLLVQHTPVPGSVSS